MLACGGIRGIGVARHKRAALSAQWERQAQQVWHPRMASTIASSNTGAEAAAAASRPEDPIVQYIVIRKDLWTEQGWPLGPLIAQACHASVAALWTYKDDDVTQSYCAPENIDHMTKARTHAHT